MKIIIWITVSILSVIIFIAFIFGWPQWRVWQQGLAGEASLKRATQERKILVEQAQAELDASGLRAQAIEIVGAKAKEFPEYRLQEFLGAFAEALQNGDIDKIIFVPTEANIPIVEAGRTVE